ncbi:TPA_exp: Uncharacterized protein A8136_7256 [Trichophyton benhamiae CBS 112371]|uniref:Protein HRI1 n=1 Tax=Arthroderma benhamiae (strain ATCC MYA-4681 / CBS 112371) TaxID=663331 RepID=D4ATD2_ARTBC|nr:uncharacterized protein ARB_07496 [Trichophyton benhamiae CBS 112371]EFE33551.1 conserved hypothetical protein [Trichophyton benhamiae CBS 112371]DAA76579.1 TPA_exp: Uncharacterized protein A8136_7256 [Trichophyton benhamiae CBS 112371]
MAVSTANISTRVSLRWPPEPAYETTDTASLSVGGWYVDLRIHRESGKVEWAMAGQRVVESASPSIVVFTHAIDSLQLFDTADIGTFKKLSNGDDLETGKMIRHDLPGAPVCEYEELWRSLDIPKTVPKGHGYAWVLESEEMLPNISMLKQGYEGVKVVKTFLGRVPGHYIALRQTQWYQEKQVDGKPVLTKAGGAVSGRREIWDATTGQNAAVKYAVGAECDNLPSLVAAGESLQFSGEGEGPWRSPGRVIIVDGTRFLVRAFEELPITINGE